MTWLERFLACLASVCPGIPPAETLTVIVRGYLYAQLRLQRHGLTAFATADGMVNPIFESIANGEEILLHADANELLEDLTHRIDVRIEVLLKNHGTAEGE